MNLYVLSIWTLLCWFLEIPELVILFGAWFLVMLIWLTFVYFSTPNYKWVRMILAIESISITLIPIVFYGLDSLFVLYLIIPPLAAILMFSSQEKKGFFIFLIIYLALFVSLVIWNIFEGPLFQLTEQQTFWVNYVLIFGALSVAFYYSLTYWLEYTKYKNLIQEEQKKSDQLLLSIFPAAIAEQLRETNKSLAKSYEEVTVIFIDLVGFTKLSGSMSPANLVELLDEVFSVFDELVEKHNIEKIKTIGDAYLAVCGLPIPDSEHAQKVANFALDINKLFQTNRFKGHDLKVRMGIHTGKVVAGVIGNSKFSYDLWGDTVNIASRFEAAGISEKIHITKAVQDILEDDYVIENAGEINIKGKGMMESFFLLGKK